MSAVTASSARAGDRFELLSEVVTTQQLVRYAGASGDYNRIHYDQAYALEAGLGGVIAHGMLTMAFMGRAASALAGPRGVVRQLAARFTSPVRPGDAVHVSGVVLDARPAGMSMELRCELQADVDGRAVAAGTATLLVPSGVPQP